MGLKPSRSKRCAFGFGGVTIVGSPEACVRALVTSLSGADNMLKRRILTPIEVCLGSRCSEKTLLVAEILLSLLINGN